MSKITEAMRKSCDYCRFNHRYDKEKCTKCEESDYSEWRPTLKIGTVYFKCLRHNDGTVHQAPLEIRLYHVSTMCPICHRNYSLITFNADTYTNLEESNREEPKITIPPFIPFFFYCDRKLFITKIEFNENWVMSLPYKIDKEHHPTWR